MVPSKWLSTSHDVRASYTRLTIPNWWETERKDSCTTEFYNSLIGRTWRLMCKHRLTNVAHAPTIDLNWPKNGRLPLPNGSTATVYDHWYFSTTKKICKLKSTYSYYSKQPQLTHSRDPRSQKQLDANSDNIFEQSHHVTWNTFMRIHPKWTSICE